MSNLMPYRYRNNLTKSQRNFFGDDFFNPFFFGNAFNSPFRVDVRDEGDHFLLEAELPGVAKDQISLEMDDGVLTISAAWETQEKREQGYIINERRSGRVQRAFTVDNVREDEISAAYEDGILKVTMPKRTEEARASRRISIQ